MAAKMILLVLAVSLVSTDVFGAQCRGQNLAKLMKKFQRRGYSIFKEESPEVVPQTKAGCNSLRLPSYTRRCSHVMRMTEDPDRLPRFLMSAVCENCDPSCCAVTYWVPVLKRQSHAGRNKVAVWALTQEEVVVAYARP